MTKGASPLRQIDEPYGKPSWRFTDDLEAEPEFDHFASLAATVCGTPAAAVTLIAQNMQWIKGAVGIDRGAMPADQSFCIHTVHAQQYLAVEDASMDARFRNNPLVTGPDHIRFYAGMPLLIDGEPVGALCVIDTEARAHGLSSEQRQALAMLATQASLQLQLRRAVSERDDAVRELNSVVGQLSWVATHDHLTGVGNRALLRQTLESRADTQTPPFGLLAIDVDHFKQINDSFGHQTGDELLKEIARRLTQSVRTDDIVIRFGGDEFAVVLDGMADEIQLAELADRLLNAMRAPFLHDGRALECRITIGGALWPHHSLEVSEVVRYADAALYEAKSRGRGVFVMFEKHLLAEQSRGRIEIARARTALAAGQIVPFYQPKVDLKHGTILGLEALLRIVEPGRVAILPHSIAAAFDEAELAQAIGRSMLDQVLRDMRRWLDAGLQFGRVAINVSATELGDPTYADRLTAALAEHDIAPGRLELEILETVLLDQRSAVMLATVRAVSDAGVRIAFDDFGTGYAALAHLPSFPVDTIKIDQLFVRQLDDGANQAIVRALLALASELGLEAIAEGVETPRHAAQLLSLGCAIGQGFLYSKALPAEKIAHALSRQARTFRSPLNRSIPGRPSLSRKAA
ncbi:EAL domain-containing protein [Sphingomonas sp. MA1305]|uniref:putative bifunctional diguanylate cyclase/phosphodiesterase n=1 Tax=Sphingomonas sp. MA1305 TaxID=2479204 RepID=UPI0018DFF8EB|nr:EAL domain-containing protein [Sphingomonas sp. MA1305]MBI0476690.1 EAL domain-containing protein [Sphingomonas sp. MA1305]